MVHGRFPGSHMAVMSPSLRLVVTGSATRDCAACKVTPPIVPIQMTASIQGPGWKKTPWNPCNHCRGLPLDWAQRWLPLQILRHPAGEICRCRCQLSPEISRALKQTAKLKLHWSVLSFNLFMFVCHSSNVQAIAFVTFTRSESGTWKNEACVTRIT